jgi:O-antigen/teichoic acid export membrane protein
VTLISKNFIKSSALYTLAGSLPMASAVLLLPFYQYYLSAELFGQLSIFLAFSILIQIVTTYSFDSSVYLHFHDFKNDDVKIRQFISSTFLFVLIISGVVAVVLLPVGPYLFKWVSNDKIQFFPYGIAAIFTAIGQSILKINSGLLQSQQKPTPFFIYNFSNFFLTVSFTALGLIFYPETLIGPVGGRMLAFLLTAAGVLWSIFNNYGTHFNFLFLRSTFSYNSYQFVYQLQQWVINYADRFILILIVTAADLGVYDFTLKCLVLLDLIISGLYNSFFPKILALNSDKQIEGSSIVINRYFHGLTAAIMLMISTTILILPLLIEWFVTNPDYLKSIDIIPYVALIYLPRAMKLYFSMPYNLMKFSRPLPIIFLIISVLKLILSYLFIRLFNIYGAVLATFICQLVEIKLLHAWIQTRYVFKMNWKKMFWLPVMLMLLIILLEPIKLDIQVWIHLMYVIFTCFILLWSYRNELALILEKKNRNI